MTKGQGRGQCQGQADGTSHRGSDSEHEEDAFDVSLMRDSEYMRAEFPVRGSEMFRDDFHGRESEIMDEFTMSAPPELRTQNLADFLEEQRKLCEEL